MASAIKKFPSGVQARRQKALPIVFVLLLFAMFMQSRIDPMAREMRQEEDLFITATGSLNNEFMLLPLLGFREAAAGLLWVRCDEFFHSGDYDAILPLVRLITWLDPHADNVFITGAWHLAYNFTDSSERSDRRYIIPAHELLKEGIRKNPRIPDISFELGWQNYDKTKDFSAAIAAFQKSINTIPWKGSDDYPYGAPLKTHHILAHAYTKLGRIPDAMMEWKRALQRSTEQLEKDPKSFTFKSMHSAEERNLAMLAQRFADRYTATGHSPTNPTPYPAVLIPPPGTDKTPRPWNMSFRPIVLSVRKNVLKMAGRINMADGARVDIRLTDWEYDLKEKERRKNISTKMLERFDVDSATTIMQESISVRKNKYEREIDMSKDTKMYSFKNKSKLYRVVVSFNPRATSPHVQDRHGYSGEGLIDRPEVIEYDRRPEFMGTKLIDGQGGEGPVWDGKTIPDEKNIKDEKYGQPNRMLKVTLKLSEQQIFGLKPISAKDIVPNEAP